MVTTQVSQRKGLCARLARVGVKNGLEITPFPNPFNQELTIYSQQLLSRQEPGENVVVKVYDVYGGKVFSKSVSSSDLSAVQPVLKIQTSGWAQGIYFLEVSSGEKSVIKKIVKE